MKQVKTWNELTKSERSSVMEFVLIVGNEEKRQALDVIEPLLRKELKRLDSAQRYHNRVPLLFRDTVGIRVELEQIEGKTICTNVIGKNDAELTTTVCALLTQAKFNFDEAMLSGTHFNMIAKLLNEVDPKILSSGFLAYTKGKSIDKNITDWL